MRLTRRIVGPGLGMMGAVALATVIWPVVAGLVTGLLVTVLSAAAGVLAMVAGRRVRSELVWRRELRTMPSLDGLTYGDAAAGPTLAQLRESA